METKDKLFQDKLLTLLKNFKQLLMDGLHQESQIQCIAQALEAVEANLGSGQFNIHCMSHDLAQAEYIKECFSTYPALSETYQVYTHELLTEPVEAHEAQAFAFLILQNPLEQSPTHYALPTTSLLTVGRKPVCDIAIADHYTAVSGQHLEISCLLGDRHIPPQWYVENSKHCRNGTYVNGKLLVERHLLQSGDRLVLGDRTPNVQTPEFRFEDAPTPKASRSMEDRIEALLEQVKGCIVLLVPKAEDELSSSETAILNLSHTTPGTSIFILNLQNQKISLKQVSQAGSSDQNTSLEWGDFCQYLASLPQKQIFTLQMQSAVTQIASGMARTERILLEKHQFVLQAAEKLKVLGESRSQKRMKTDEGATLLKQINEQRLVLAEAIETSLEQSKHDLLDDSLASSILQRFSDLIDSFPVRVVKSNKKKFLELKVEDYEGDINDFLMGFCQEELLEWSDEEWQKIRQAYGSGGLEGWISDACKILEALPKSREICFTEYVLNELDLQEVFQASLRKIPGRIEYREVSILTFFIKRVRSSVFQVMSLLFLLSFLGLSRGSFIRSVNRYISGSTFFSLIVLGILAWLLYKLYHSYQQDKMMERQKASEKIRQDLKSYYHKIIKNRFVEKLTRNLKISYKQEMNRLEKSLRVYSDSSSQESDQWADCKTQLQEYQNQLSFLETKLKNLRKMHDELQKLCSRNKVNG